MGDIADMYYEQYLMDGLIDDSFEEVDTSVWPTDRKGTIKLIDMETSHIINCINLINRTEYSWREEWLPAFYAELDRRGVKYKK